MLNRRIFMDLFLKELSNKKDFTISDFKIILDKIIKREINLFERKQEIYGEKESPFINFQEGSNLNRITPLQYGFMLVSKHILALKKLIDKIAKGQGYYNKAEEELFLELIGDIRIYVALFFGMYLQDFTQSQTEERHNV